jgi:hypothetical protein
MGIMLHRLVQRELFGTGCGLGSRRRNGGAACVRISRKQVTAVLLMMMILGSWAVDSLHLNLVPRSMHQSVASMIDAECEHLPPSLIPSIDSTVAHNPLDDSPITFGSVVLLGVVCGTGLLALAVSSTQNKAH